MSLSGETARIPKPSTEVIRPVVQATPTTEIRRPSDDAIRLSQFIDRQIEAGKQPRSIIEAVADSVRITTEQQAAYVKMTEEQQAEARLRQDVLKVQRDMQVRFLGEEVFGRYGRLQDMGREEGARFLIRSMDHLGQVAWDKLLSEHPNVAEKFGSMPEIQEALLRKKAREKEAEKKTTKES